MSGVDGVRGPKRRLTRKSAAEMARRAQAGATVKEIAAATGYSVTDVRSVLGSHFVCADTGLAMMLSVLSMRISKHPSEAWDNRLGQSPAGKDMLRLQRNRLLRKGKKV
jgi:hypothetical protein